MKHTARRSKRNAKEENFGFLSLLKGSARGMGLSLLVGLPVLVFATLILTKLSDPLAYTEGVGIGLFLLLSLLGGFLAARQNGGAPLPSGALVGMLWILFSVLLGIFFKDDSVSSSAMILWRLLGIGLSVGGAFLGCKRFSPQRRKKHGRTR